MIHGAQVGPAGRRAALAISLSVLVALATAGPASAQIAR